MTLIINQKLIGKTQMDVFILESNIPDNKIPETNMGPIWGRRDPGGPHAGPMNFVIWDMFWINAG